MAALMSNDVELPTGSPSWSEDVAGVHQSLAVIFLCSVLPYASLGGVELGAWREPGFANRDLRQDTSTRFSRSRVLTRPRAHVCRRRRPQLLHQSTRELIRGSKEAALQYLLPRNLGITPDRGSRCATEWFCL